MQLSATFLMREFFLHFSFKAASGLGNACRKVTQAKGMASEQGSPPQLLRCPFAARYRS